MNLQSTIQKEPPAYIQLQQNIRERIENGQIPQGMRLPPSSEIAKQFGTSVYTVQTALAGLVKEGLLQRSQKAGTFVSGDKPVISCIGLFYGANFWSNPEMEYARCLHEALERKLAEKRIKCQLFINSMFSRESEGLSEELVQAVKKRKIQGLIVPLVGGKIEAFLNGIDIPYAINTGEENISAVNTDRTQMLELAVKYLKDSGCRTAGIISQYGIQYKAFYDSYVDLLNKAGIKIKDEWILHNDQNAPTMEEYGELQFHRLWRQKEKPDGLFVYHDVNAKGVINAVTQLRVAVPEQLKLVVLKNDEIDFHQPFELQAVVLKIADIADALIDHVLGNKKERKIVDFHLKTVPPSFYHKEK